MKKFVCILLSMVLLAGSCCVFAESTGARELKILFTHDIHSYFDITHSMGVEGIKEHGGAARLATLLNRNRNENTLYLDAGDFAMGTLLQAGYSTDAFELRLLGKLGCDVTTFGNHEFDFGGYGTAKMLESAVASGDALPAFVQSNMILNGELNEEQQALASAMEHYGAKEYILKEVNGLRVGIFGLLGPDGIVTAPTSGMNFMDYIEAAKKTVSALQAEKADVIICLSHSGTSGDGVNGDDFELARAVPEIDVIISGHSHSSYTSPVRCGKTFIVSAGEYLFNLGSLTLSVSDGNVACTDYALILCDASVEEDPEIKALYEGYKSQIEATYLAEENCHYSDVICHSDFNFTCLGEMYATHEEYPLGNLIADSYLYEARRNGIDDIDVALVVLGTIRGAFPEGDITVSDAFEICSLGVGSDGSAGHPVLAAWITGRELKLLVELDASLGPMVSSIKMSYAGLRYTFNTKRMIMDRAYDIRLVRQDGSLEEIEDDRLYKASCNMYALNMLGMLNGLTKGILSITPKRADGTPIPKEEYYDYSILNQNGKEIKEWIAFKNYLSSFPEKNNIPTIPERYASKEGRKEKVSLGGFAIIAHPGPTTLFVLGLIVVLLAMILILILTRKQRKARKAEKKKRKAARKQQ